MSDNVLLNAGSGGSTLRTDDDGTAHWQYVKLVWGADNTRTIVTAADGIPVQPGTGTTWVLGAGTAEFGKLAAGSAVIGAVTQSGTWNVTNVSGTISLPTGASTAANQATGNAALANIQTAVEGVLTVGSHAVTNAGTFVVQLNGAALTALQLIDDAVYADDADWTDATSKHMLVGGLYQSAPQTVTDGDVAPFQVDVNGNIIESNSAAVLVDIGAIRDDAASIQVDAGTIATDTTSISGDASSIATYTSAIQTAVELLDNTVAILGTATYVEGTTSGTVVGAVRNDDLATLANTDNECAPLQVSSAGALYTEPAQQVGYVFNGSEKCTIKRKSAVMADTGNMLAGVAGKKFRILALFLKATSATVTNVWLGTATDTDVLGNTGNPIPLAVDADGDNDSGFVLPFNLGGWTETSTVNEALVLTMSAAQDVIYAMTYIEVS